MANREYATGFYFKLSFKGEDAAFQEVSGITKEFGVEEITGGGENRFKYRLPTVVTSQNLVLKRALMPKGSKLLSWCSGCLDGGLAHKVVPQDITVSLLNQSANPSASWTFHKAYPLKYALGDLKSQENNIAIESMEFAYSYFSIV